MKHRTDVNFKAVIQRFEDQPISTSQLKFVRDLMEQKNITVDDIIMDGFPPLEKLTKGLASELLDYLMKQKEKSYNNRDSESGHISEFLPVIDINDES